MQGVAPNAAVVLKIPDVTALAQGLGLKIMSWGNTNNNQANHNIQRELGIDMVCVCLTGCIIVNDVVGSISCRLLQTTLVTTHEQARTKACHSLLTCENML